MEDPTAPQTTEDDKEEEEEQICLHHLTYLTRLPNEVDENDIFLTGPKYDLSIHPSVH